MNINNYIRKEDGYLNATKLCQIGGKRIDNFISSKKTLQFIDQLCIELNIQNDKLIYLYQYGKSRNTYYHPLLGTYLAFWISSNFAVKVSLWIEEWKTINNNKDIYNNEISILKSDEDNTYQKEKEIQLKLQNELGGEIEVKTKTGFIDLLTETEIIEIKSGKNWKHALGQILAYSIYYPKHKKIIYLFDIKNDEIINKVCEKYDINVKYEK